MGIYNFMYQCDNIIMQPVESLTSRTFVWSWMKFVYWWTGGVARWEVCTQRGQLIPAHQTYLAAPIFRGDSPTPSFIELSKINISRIKDPDQYPYERCWSGASIPVLFFIIVAVSLSKRMPRFSMSSSEKFLAASPRFLVSICRRFELASVLSFIPSC